VAFAWVVVHAFYGDPTTASDWLNKRANAVDASPWRGLDMILATPTVNSPLWSLQWEIWFSMLLPAYIWAATRLRGTKCALIGALGLLAVTQWEMASSLGAIAYFPVFGLGVLMARNADALHAAAARVGRMRTGWPLVLAASVLLLTFDWMARGVPGVPVIFLGICRVGACLGACLVVFAAGYSPGFKRFLIRRPVHWLGVRSFSLYLTHEPVALALGFAIGPSATVLLVPAAVPTALLVAAVFYVLVERPSHRLARAIRRRVDKQEPRHVRALP